MRAPGHPRRVLIAAASAAAFVVLPALTAGPARAAAAGAASLTTTPSAGCLPLLGNCGAAAAAPTVTLGAATAVTATGATLNAQVTPNGAATTYQFEYAPNPPEGSGAATLGTLTGDATGATTTPSAGGACAAAGTGSSTSGGSGGSAPGLASTPSETIAAGAGEQDVTADLSDLQPCTTYTIAIVASNAKGSRSAFGTLTTAAPVRPTLGVTLVGTGQPELKSGQPLTVAARVTGQIALYTEYFGAPLAQLTSAPGLASLTIPSLARTTVPSSGYVRFLPVTPTRNTRFRVTIGTSVSPWLTVYVQPLVELYRTVDPRRGGFVDLEYMAAGDLSSGVRRGPRAWFYHGGSPSGPFTRVGSTVFRRHGASLQARTAVRAGITRTRTGARPSGYYVACTRGPIIPDMGRPFHDARCGAASLG